MCLPKILIPVESGMIKKRIIDNVSTFTIYTIHPKKTPDHLW